tara:strand:+ start:1438 stop:2199 length:762 start_codon:yes stop_codon:yes gene_type:complete
MTDAVNTYQEEPAESQEHIDAMLAKVEGSQQDPERPDWLPEKFNSVEDMAKAYSALESKLGQPQQEKGAEVSEEQVADATPSDIADALDANGLDFDVFQQEYEENGQLSSDAYAALAEAGFSEAVVDSWIQGQNALSDQVQSSMYDLVGGADQYQGLVQWAADNLPADEIDAFNSTMGSRNTNMIKLAIQGLNARYRSEAEPNLVRGQTGSVSSGGKFDSNAELTAAMRDPRYAKDPAYRQQVADKLAKSSLF